MRPVSRAPESGFAGDCFEWPLDLLDLHAPDQAHRHLGADLRESFGALDEIVLVEGAKGQAAIGTIDVRDAPGFASSRLGVAIGMEAIRMVEEGVASVADIDRAMKLGYGFPMGPLELTDLVGLDVRLSIAEHLARELGERFEPPRLLREKVAKGELGKKSGQGFYEWSE